MTKFQSHSQFKKKLFFNLIIFFEGENKIELKHIGLNNILLITNQQTPKQVLKIDDSLIINYGTYIEVLERIDFKYILNFAIDYLIIELLNYPFIYGFYENQIILFKKNILNPLISCNELMKYNYIYYTTNHLFKTNVLFKSEIISEESQNQNCQILNAQVYLRNTTFQLKIYKQQSTDSCVFPNILDFNQSNLKCQIQQLQQENNCQNLYNSNIRWQKFKYNKELYILFQKKSNVKLYLKNCNNNLLMELGRYENFEEKNIYEFKNQFLLIFQQQTKVLIIYCESINFNQTIIEFKEQVIDIFYENYFIHLITSSCSSYIIISKHSSLFQNNQYLLRDGVCIKMKFLNGYASYIHDGSIVMMKNNITNIMKFPDASVVNIFQIYTFQVTYIIHLRNQDGDHLSKYIFINNQLIKLYDIPKLNFQFTSPLNYKTTKYLLVVAAYTNSGINVLLVYYCNNNYSNSLIDIIQVDNFNFYMSDEDLLIYNFNQEIRMVNIKFDKYICEVSLFTEFVKKISIPLILTTKFNISRDYLQTLNLNFYNLIKNLWYKESMTIPTLLETLDCMQMDLLIILLLMIQQQLIQFKSKGKFQN
ncbi:unnamed protein product [Paramecium pentaurelia]|uniref:Uncharacterized protein n=1 Tax=Paramecium pentaurelia TaxID=43138 RepID=A0A8S1WKE4_9CILI|nr:unnamed protein product [Paramecium pentaurelia]